MNTKDRYTFLGSPEYKKYIDDMRAYSNVVKEEIECKNHCIGPFESRLPKHKLNDMRPKFPPLMPAIPDGEPRIFKECSRYNISDLFDVRISVHLGHTGERIGPETAIGSAALVFGEDLRFLEQGLKRGEIFSVIIESLISILERYEDNADPGLGDIYSSAAIRDAVKLLKKAKEA